LSGSDVGDHGYVARRIEWIDLVKAASVLLVVFMHASNTLVDLGGTGSVATTLQLLNHLVEPLRMPMFFLVSGMLAASAVRRPWSASTNRTTGMLYLYVLWMLLYFGFTALFGATVPDPLGSIVLARSGFWYLYAMAIFFVIARLLRNQPGWLVVAVALLPNILRPVTDQILGQLIPGTLFTSMAMNLAFFLVGIHFKDLVAAAAQRATPQHVAVLGVLAAGAGLVFLRSPQMVGQSLLPLSVLWLGFGVGLAALITRSGVPAWARYVGSRTLAVYVMQWPVLFIVTSYLPGWTVSHPLAQLAFPFVFTAGVAALALWLYSMPATAWLFRAPTWVTRPQDLRLPGTPVPAETDVAPATR